MSANKFKNKGDGSIFSVKLIRLKNRTVPFSELGNSGIFYMRGGIGDKINFCFIFMLNKS